MLPLPTRGLWVENWEEEKLYSTLGEKNMTVCPTDFFKNGSSLKTSEILDKASGEMHYCAKYT